MGEYKNATLRELSDKFRVYFPKIVLSKVFIGVNIAFLVLFFLFGVMYESYMPLVVWILLVGPLWFLAWVIVRVCIETSRNVRG